MDCREDRGRERELGREFFLLDPMQAFDKERKMPSMRFGPAEADAMTRWKWRRKLLERLIVRHRQAGAIQPVEVRRR